MFLQVEGKPEVGGRGFRQKCPLEPGCPRSAEVGMYEVFASVFPVFGSLASLGKGKTLATRPLVMKTGHRDSSFPLVHLPCPWKGRPRQTPSNFVTTRAHAYKISFGLIPSYVRYGRRGTGGGWRRGQLQRSQSPGGQCPHGPPSRTPPWTWARCCSQWHQNWG